MRLASILNCSAPVLGGAQNSSECSMFTIVSDSRSHCLLLDRAHIWRVRNERWGFKPMG